MGNKINPSKFDCYARAEPDEPMFVLLGRDPLANLLVALWADARERLGEDPEKIAEAMRCAEDMCRYSLGKKGPESMRKAVEAIDACVRHYVSEMKRNES